MDVTLMKTPWPHTDVTVDVREEAMRGLVTLVLPCGDFG